MRGGQGCEKCVGLISENEDSLASIPCGSLANDKAHCIKPVNQFRRAVRLQDQPLGDIANRSLSRRLASDREQRLMLPGRQPDLGGFRFAEGGETSQRGPEIGERGIVAVVQGGRSS